MFTIYLLMRLSWAITDSESDAYIKNKPSIYTTAEIDNKFSSLETNIDWKESVETYDEIASAYPDPQDGWTVNVQDTDYTYRFNGTEWIAISANAIPKVTSSIDGLFSKEDYIKFESICEGSVTGVKGNAESTYRSGTVNITPANIGLGNVANERQYSASNPQTNATGSSGSCTGNSATSTKLKTPRSIDGVRFDGSADITHFGVCETAAGTAEKTVSIPGFILKKGARICVFFKNKLESSNDIPISININSTGAIQIARYHNGSAFPLIAHYIESGIYEFIYYDSYWYLTDYNTQTPIKYHSYDVTDSDVTNWASVKPLENGLNIISVIERISYMLRNVRYLYKLLGKTSISSIGDGTVTGAVSKLHTDLSDLNAKSHSGWFVQEIGNMVEINTVSPLTVSGTFSESTGTYFAKALLTVPAQIRPADSTYMNVQSTVQSAGALNSTFVDYNAGSGVLAFHIATWKPFQNTSVKLLVRIRYNK